LEKYSFPTLKDAFRGIHAPTSFEEVRRARDRLAYQEFFDARRRVARLRASRSLAHAVPMASGERLAERFEGSLPFVLTDSQKNAIGEIARDLDSLVPMNRLLVGDVGSGKTAVAAACVARCVGAGCQAAVLVPTTILSSQFARACTDWLAPLGVRTAELTRDIARSARDELLWRARDGEVDVIIGAHSLLSDGVRFKSLGLLVIDEQQRFGVIQRERIVSANRGAHVLMMSATPIPRTLRMALYGDVDYTEMRARPGGGRIKTRVMSDNHIGELYRFLAERISRGRDRCYWVCPAIGDESSASGARSSSVAWRSADIERKIPHIPVGRLSGVMPPEEKHAIMRRFAEGPPGILVSTTVIEVGVDVRGANIIVIESASSYGLSQLHQMRGRVGRGERDGICILLDSAANIRANERLSVLIDCDDGFKIAEEDLRIRGAGEIAGVRQHGDENFWIADIVRDRELMEAAAADAESIDVESPGHAGDA
jgi:ATP-dependent DNA helicase RecG